MTDTPLLDPSRFTAAQLAELKSIRDNIGLPYRHESYHTAYRFIASSIEANANDPGFTPMSEVGRVSSTLGVDPPVRIAFERYRHKHRRVRLKDNRPEPTRNRLREPARILRGVFKNAPAVGHADKRGIDQPAVKSAAPLLRSGGSLLRHHAGGAGVPTPITPRDAP